MIIVQVNPDPDANDDAEIDIVKQIFSHSGASRSPSAPDIPAKFPDDRSVTLSINESFFIFLLKSIFRKKVD